MSDNKISEAMIAILERCDDMAMQQRCDSASIEAFARYHGVTTDIANRIIALACEYKNLPECN